MLEKKVCAMLKIGASFVFEDDWSRRQSCLMYFECDEDESASWSVDIGFAVGEFDGEKISPSLCINPIDTDKKSVTELVGESFSLTTIEEICDREDSFYIYEHEPLANYELTILEIEMNKAHIKCNGTLITDGYAKPFTKEKFEIDSWIPVIESAKDWKKFEL